MPRFSVILPAYNVAEFLPAALDSVLAQTCPDWECLCVDDGSADDTPGIARSYAARDPRVRVLTQSHGGVSRARNLALDHASGEWLCFLDGDDLLHPKLLATCRDASARYPEAPIVTFGHTTGSRLAFAPVSRPATEEVDCSRELATGYWSRQFWDAVYRRDFVGELRIQPYSCAEDLLFWYSCLYRAERIVHCEAELYGYRIRPGSAAHGDPTVDKAMDGCRAWHDIFDLHARSGRRVSAFALRRMVRGAYIDPAVALASLPDSADTRRAWDEWLALARARRASQPIPWPHRMLIAGCAALRSRFLAKLLLAWPARCLAALRRR